MPQTAVNSYAALSLIYIDWLKVPRALRTIVEAKGNGNKSQQFMFVYYHFG